MSSPYGGISMVDWRYGVTMDDETRERALRRFRNMRGRGVNLDFPTLGPTVPASTPDELETETEAALAAEVSEDDAN